MSLLLEYIENNPKETKLNWYWLWEATALFTQAEALHYEKQAEIEAAKFRLNSKGAGCKPKLFFGEQMLLTLVYLSQLHTFQYLFNLELVSLLLIIFSLLVRYFTELLPASLLEQVKKKSGDFEWVLEILTQYSLTVDSTEQPIERPSDREEQEKFSQAEKSYPKNQFIVLPKGEDIVDVKVGDPGPTSDINHSWKSDQICSLQKFKGDKAYIGEEQIDTTKNRKSELTLSKTRK